MKNSNIHFDEEVREMTISMFLAGKSEFEIERAIHAYRRKRGGFTKRRRRRALAGESRGNNESRRGEFGG